MADQKELGPFHETIAKAFRSCDGGGAFKALIELVTTTKVPKGHDEIIIAIDECVPRLDPLGMETWPKLAEQAKESLLAQKQKAEEDEDKKTRYEDLMRELALKARGVGPDPLSVKGDKHI